MGRFVIYGYDLSYFTRKVEAAFELHGLPAVRRPKTLLRTPFIERLGGTHQVPVVRTPRWRFMADTTPIIEYLDDLNPDRRLFPQGVQGIAPRIVEEWLDEWFPRVVIHFRWNYDDCSRHASAHLARETLPGMPAFLQRKIARKITGWGKRAVRALALDCPQQQRTAESVCEELVAALDQQLASTAFAMGDRPTAVDAVLVGAIRAHLAADPEPRRRLNAFPRVTRWAEQPFVWSGREQLPHYRETTHFARFVLRQCAGDYGRYALANAAALEAKKKAFELDVEGEAVSFLARRYPETSRRRLLAWLRDAEPAGLADLRAWIDQLGLAAIFPLD